MKQVNVAAMLLFVVGAIAEAPVGRQYLPPSPVGDTARVVPPLRYNVPSALYGAPSPLLSSFAPSVSLRSRSSITNNLANIPRPLSTQYGVPGRVAPVATPLSTYGAPILPPVPLAGPALIPTQYGAPAPIRLGGVSPLPLSTQYGAPVAARSGLANTYGAPADFSRKSGAPAAQYGAPLAGYSAQEDPLAEPANYQFSYAVQDAESGSEFGQEESRQLETAQGSYRVLLPDGRLQVVEYQADEEGYKPEVRYEETALSRGANGPYPASRALQGPY